MDGSLASAGFDADMRRVADPVPAVFCRLLTVLFQNEEEGSVRNDPKRALHSSGVPVQVMARYQALLPGRFRETPTSFMQRSTKAWQSIVEYGVPM